MTVESSQQYVAYATDGVTTAFPVPFYFLDATHIYAQFIDPAENSTQLINGSDFTVTGAGNEAGGVLTLATAKARGFTLYIDRQVPVTQETAYQQNSAFPAKTTETALDKLTMIVQQLTSEFGRAIRYPVTEYDANGSLPAKSARAGMLLAFDSNGNHTVVPIPASVGAGDLKNEIWIDGTDYVSGTSTSLTLSRAYVSKANLGSVVMGGVTQSPRTYQLQGLTLTFLDDDGVPTPIPLGISEIWCTGGTTISLNQPATGSVIDSSVSAGTKLFNRINTFNIKDFGAVGDGIADDSNALEAAIKAASPFEWKGTTRATELNATGGTVYFPRGIYRVTRKIRLAPHLRLVGDGPADDFAARNGAGGTATGGIYRLGSAVFADIEDFSTYAVDTSPYNNVGVRTDDRLQNGTDSFSGHYTQVPAISIENITFFGNWTCKGLNLAGAELVRLKNVYIKGFTVGVRGSAIWYGSYEDLRVVSNYRGILNWESVTDLTMINVNVVASVDGVTYNPAVSGRDAGDPPPVVDLTQPMIDLNTGIVNFYGNVEGLNVTVENFPQCFLSVNAVDSYRGIYVEGCSGVVLRIQGSDQQNAYFEFDTITTNSGDLLWSSLARVTVEARNHNYTQSGFGKLVNFMNTGGIRAYVPAFRGLYLNASDFIPATSFRTLADEYSEGGWSPILGFGGSSAGDQSVTTGKWIRNGRVVTAKFSIRIPVLSGAAGNAAIAGLPFIPENVDGTDYMGGVVLFAFNAPAGMLAQIQPGVSGILLTNSSGVVLTQSGFSNGCDIRGYVTYMVQAGQ